MVFSSAVFLMLFLPLCWAVNFVVRRRIGLSNAVLLAASLLFYAWGEPVMVLLMIFSAVFNHLIGAGIGKSKSQGGRRGLLALGVAGDLAILGWYKYAGFAATLVNAVLRRTIVPVPAVTLPIGISFFTFQAISYIADVYRGETDAAPGPMDTALYIAFFPQLIAGPIVKYRDIARQLRERSVTMSGTAEGFRRFVIGLGKKVLIANVLGLCADTVFNAPIGILDSRSVWIAALCYTFQIYYDFSGYSDMAIGLGRMFGFVIPENFRYPYLSRSISEFWRRWHISLGSWFREYLYIPLGGNRKGTRRTYTNLLLVFFFTGLWHGADVSFIIWGMYHGLLSIAERLGLKRLLEKHGVLGALYCFLAVLIGWVFFRANDTMTALALLKRMFLPWQYADCFVPLVNYMSMKTIFTLVAAVLGAGLMQTLCPAAVGTRWKHSAAEAVFLTAVLVLCMAAIAGSTYNPFIYFQF